MDKPQIIEQPAERRQIAKVLDFPPALAPFIEWQIVAQQARDLGSHFEARFADDGACTVTLFWSYTGDEVGPLEHPCNCDACLNGDGH